MKPEDIEDLQCLILSIRETIHWIVIAAASQNSAKSLALAERVSETVARAVILIAAYEASASGSAASTTRT